MAEVRFDVQVVNAEDGARRLKKIEAAQKKLAAAERAGLITSAQRINSTNLLNQAQGRLTLGLNTTSAAFWRQTASSKRADESADILAQTIGGTLPTATRKFIAESKLLGSVLKSVFSASLVLGFVAFAIPAMDRLSKKAGDFFFDVKRKNEELARAVKTNNWVLELHNDIVAARNELRLMKVDGIELIRLQGVIFAESLQPEITAREDQIKQLKEELVVLDKVNLLAIRRAELEEMSTNKIVRRAELELEISGLNLERFSITNKIVDQEFQLGRLVERRRIDEKRVAELIRQHNRALREQNTEIKEQRDIRADPADLQREKDRLSRLREQNALINQTQKANELLQIAQLEGIPRIIAARDRELAQLEELAQKHRDNAELIAQLEARKVLVIADANRRIAQVNREQLEKTAAEHQAAFEQMTANVEGFFQQVFLTARSFGDVWKQLVQQMVRVFVTGISQMVARWLLGMKIMKSAGAGGGGGRGG